MMRYKQTFTTAPVIKMWNCQLFDGRAGSVMMVGLMLMLMVMLMTMTMTMTMTMIMIIMPSHHLLSDDSRKRRSRVRGLSCLTTHNITSIIIVLIMNILIILSIITISISRKSSCLTQKTKIPCIIDTIITIIIIIIIVKASNI